jgi:hypothetical protein
MRLLVIISIAIAAARTCCAHNPPAFTADYYLMHPQRYLNKTTTLAVAFLTPRNEQRADHLAPIRCLHVYPWREWRTHFCPDDKKQRAEADCFVRNAFAVFWQESQGYDAARHFSAGKGREARILLFSSVAFFTNARPPGGPIPKPCF